MFKHILLPTDGSKTAAIAIKKGIALAKENHAVLTAIYAIPDFHVISLQVDMLEDTKAKYEADSMAYARQILKEIAELAKEAGVKCDTAAIRSDVPHEAIIKTANEKGCDLIVMASHGRKGVAAVLLGSETLKVLTHSQIPVLVFR